MTRKPAPLTTFDFQEAVRLGVIAALKESGLIMSRKDAIDDEAKPVKTD